MIIKEDFEIMNWEEYFNDELKVLGDKVEKYVKDNDVEISAVVPILRGGNIPSIYLAYRLKILKITPVQYKYFFVEDKAELRQIQKVNEELFDKDDNLDMVLMGNLYGSEVETPRNDASYGNYLKGNGKGEFQSVYAYKSGLCVEGDVKKIAEIIISDQPHLLIGINDNKLKILAVNNLVD